MKVQRWHFVYQTLNLIDGKVYVGSHTSLVNPEEKFDGYLGSGVELRNAINEVGRDNFKRVTIQMCSTKEEAMELEASILDAEFVQSESTYNVSTGSAGCREHTNEVREKMSIERTGSGNSMFGRNHSSDSKRRMSLRHTGKVFSLETRAKMGESRTGTANGMYGVTREKSECPHCGKLMDVANMRRWHGENCRLANN